MKPHWHWSNFMPIAKSNFRRHLRFTQCSLRISGISGSHTFFELFFSPFFSPFLSHSHWKSRKIETNHIIRVPKMNIEFMQTQWVPEASNAIQRTHRLQYVKPCVVRSHTNSQCYKTNDQSTGSSHLLKKRAKMNVIEWQAYKVTPDIVHEYNARAKKNRVPLIIDNGKWLWCVRVTQTL